MNIARDVRHTAANLLFARSSRDPTSEWVFLKGLREHEDRGEYVPSPWWVLHWLLPRSEVKPGSVFVDYGCGKGRIVVAAARRYPFADVVGVELSTDLAAEARRLIGRERRLRSKSVRVETIDATEFQVPDRMTHAYMFNPFRGETLSRVCANIAASLERNPRAFKLIYVYPEEHDTLVAHGLRLQRQVSARRNSWVTAAVYTN